jgi:hypothetical protein
MSASVVDDPPTSEAMLFYGMDQQPFGRRGPSLTVKILPDVEISPVGDRASGGNEIGNRRQLLILSKAPTSQSDNFGWDSHVGTLLGWRRIALLSDLRIQVRMQ